MCWNLATHPRTSEKETSKAPWKGARQPSRRQDLKTAGFFGLLILLWDLFLGMKQWLAGRLDMFFSHSNEKWKDCLLGNVLKLGHPSQDLRKRNVESALERSAAAQSQTRFENGRFFWALNFAVGFVFGDEAMVGWSFGHVFFSL